MTRRAKILRNIAIGGGALILVLGVAAVLIIQSSWFRNYVKQTIITSIEDGTGGRVEATAFQFDWTHLRAVLTDLVVHGNESADVAPLLRVARIQVDLRLFASLHGFWNIAVLNIDQPRANIIVYADGRTNLPAPRRKSSSNQSPLETVVDLAIGHFEITGGLITFAERKQQFNVQGNNLRAQLAYNTLSGEYRGQAALQPVYMVSGRNTPVDFTLLLPVVLARDKIEMRGARISSPLSGLTIDASLND